MNKGYWIWTAGGDPQENNFDRERKEEWGL